MNKARVKKVLIALLVFLIAIEIFQPQRTNPPVVPAKSLAAHVNVPANVYSALLRSCGDCHTNQTYWPWYSHVAPLPWVITDDVNQGRRHMNFEDWDAQTDPKQAKDRLVDICQEIKSRGMPPFSYRLTHKGNRLNPQEIITVCGWSQGFRADFGASISQP